MISISRRWPVRLLKILLCLTISFMISLAIVRYILPTYAELTINNKTEEKIESLEVTAFDQTQKIAPLTENSINLLKFESHGKSQYDIKITYGSDKILTTRLSYLEGNTYDLLTLKSDDMSNDVSVKRTVRSTFMTALFTALLSILMYKCVFLRHPRP